MNENSKKKSSPGMKRIHRAADKEQIIKLLTSDGSGAFREMWRLLLFAALLGFKNNRAEPLLGGQTGEPIRQELFGNCPAWPGLLYLLDLVKTEDTEALMASEEAEDRRVKRFEEYANGGLAILDEHFKSVNCNLDSLLTFIHAQMADGQRNAPDLQVTI